MSISRIILAALLATSSSATAFAAAAPDTPPAPKPEALTTSGMPEVPGELPEKVRPYLQNRAAYITGWDADNRSMLVLTQFGNVRQLHRVAGPMGARQQLTFENEPVGSTIDPTGGTIVISKDAGGSEFNQLYRWDNGQLVLLTDGTSRNNMGPWTQDGKWLAYTSTKRNGRDTDIYMLDPRDPSTSKLVLEVDGGGWNPVAFHPDGKRLIVNNYVATSNEDLYILDMESGDLSPIRDIEANEGWSGFEIAPDGTTWFISNIGSDNRRLGILDLDTGGFEPVGDFGEWDVNSIDLSFDGSTLVITTNERGSSRMYLMDTATREMSPVDEIPLGLISGIRFAPWGDIGFTYNSATSPADAYSLNPETREVTRWTKSETGGLDPETNVQPKLLEVASFDGEPVSGFLYLPDAEKFPSPRPLIMYIHGGPEGQARPRFMGTWNYFLNELGIGVFMPNVRGSTGFGARFVDLDNGPFKREDSVKDIGAFLEALAENPAVDAARIGVTGGSYGGYMCYATAIHYPDQVNGAVCDVAISNFVTFLENTQDYRRDLRRVEYGDERDPAQRAKLIEISPLTRIDEIKAPLFVIQGANDPRVPKSEADQLVAKLRESGRNVWYMVGENEGHGFNKKENSDYLLLAEIMFWSEVMDAGDDRP